jgi:hypothetical protein
MTQGIWISTHIRPLDIVVDRSTNYIPWYYAPVVARPASRGLARHSLRLLACGPRLGTGPSLQRQPVGRHKYKLPIPQSRKFNRYIRNENIALDIARFPGAGVPSDSESGVVVVSVSLHRAFPLGCAVASAHGGPWVGFRWSRGRRVGTQNL